MDDKQLSLLINESVESQNIELKTCSSGNLSKDLWKVISAFCNTEGGQLILGVSPNGSIEQLSNEQIDKIQRDVLDLCRSAFNYMFTPDIRMTGKIVIVDILPAPAVMRPVYFKSKGEAAGTYIRAGSSNVIAGDDVRSRFAIAARGGAESLEFPDLAYKDYFDLDLVRQYIGLVNEKRNNVYASLSTLEILVKLKAVNPKQEITLFGLLAFGKDELPQDILAPTINIAVTHYSGGTKVLLDDPTKTYMDNREFNGNLLDQFRQAFQFIKSKLPISGTIDSSGQRRDYLVIPEIALREALANSIAHRDYATYSSRVQVDIFSDRVEIINPGTSLVPIDDLEIAPSQTRNPLVMNFLKDHGVTEQLARGIRTIKQTLKNAGLLEPKFENVGASFRATLYSSAFISSDDQVWLAKFSKYKLNDRQLTALAHLKNAVAGINNGEYREINNMNKVGDDKKATRDLRAMLNGGLIISSGENKSRRYYINSKMVSG